MIPICSSVRNFAAEKTNGADTHKIATGTAAQSPFVIAINRAGIQGQLKIYFYPDSDINTRKHSSSSYYQCSYFH